MTLGPAFTVLIIFDRTSDRGGSTRDLFLGRPQLRHQAINVRELCGHHFGSDLGGRRRRRRRRRRGRRRRLGLGVLSSHPQSGKMYWLPPCRKHLKRQREFGRPAWGSRWARILGLVHGKTPHHWTVWVKRSGNACAPAEEHVLSSLSHLECSTLRQHPRWQVLSTLRPLFVLWRCRRNCSSSPVPPRSICTVPSASALTALDQVPYKYVLVLYMIVLYTRCSTVESLMIRFSRQ
jgi:hypothetical protein